MPQVRKHTAHPVQDGSGIRPQSISLCVVGASAVLPNPFPSLTRRELECLSWCADGKSYWETAVILGIAERTVSFHMEAVRAKLHAATNAHAVAMALRAGRLGAAH